MNLTEEIKKKLISLKNRFPAIKRIVADKKSLFLIVAGVLGIMLIIFSEFTSGDKQKKSVKADDCEITCVDEYEIKLESKLCETLSAIDGAGRVQVMLMLDSTQETVYAVNTTQKTRTVTDNEKNNSDYDTNVSSEYIIIKGDGSTQQGLPVVMIQPRVRGVAVVCDGGNNPQVRLDIIEAVSSVFGLSSAKISVSAMSQNKLN